MVRGFIAEYLPETIRDRMDLNTLEIVKDSYVDKELAEHFSDILYKISIDGKPGFVYLLLEHKSYINKLLPFQVLRNMVKIWEQFLKQNKRAKRLPSIIPLVIYYGNTTWNVKQGLLPYLNCPESANIGNMNEITEICQH